MIRLGVIGTGGMAGEHAKAFKEMDGVEIVAACDIVEQKVERYAEKHGVPATFTDVDQMLLEAELDAVTNVTPDAQHHPTTLKAIRAGLHVLCEKPLATCYGEAREMVEVAQEAGVINMVNLSYRLSSAIHRAHEMIAEGVIGEVRHVEAGYLQSWLAGREWSETSPGSYLWRLSTAHGSTGVLGDLGVHIIDFTTYAAGDLASLDCRLKCFPKVEGDRIGEYVLDANDSAAMTVEFQNGALGLIHTTRWAAGQGNSIRLRIWGNRGAIKVDLDEAWGALQLCELSDGGRAEWKTIECGSAPSIFQRFITSIQTGENDQPDFARGAQVQKWLDACFESDAKGGPVQV